MSQRWKIPNINDDIARRNIVSRCVIKDGKDHEKGVIIMRGFRYRIIVVVRKMKYIVDSQGGVIPEADYYRFSIV